MLSNEITPHEILIALVNAADARDEEFNEWYSGIHIPEVLSLPEFLSAQRYELPEPLRGALQYRYATVYTVKGSAAEALQRLYGAGLGASDTINTVDMFMGAYSALGAPIMPQ